MYPFCDTRNKKKCKTAESFSEHLPERHEAILHPRKAEGTKFSSRATAVDGKGRGDDASNRNAFQYNGGWKTRGRKLLACLFHPRNLFTCVDCGREIMVDKETNFKFHSETARYKHYSACSGILTRPSLLPVWSHSVFSGTLKCLEWSAIPLTRMRFSSAPASAINNVWISCRESIVSTGRDRLTIY